MSLKAFHIVFIVSSILLALAFGIWGIGHVPPPNGYLTGGGAFLCAVGLILYFVRFLKKFKGVSLW
ncbi:MAG: hypothetical protein D6812_04225 [Deltaproteobacteria bacterium]|nr:MAG: hypothetical protein D6812_04225 [Deltaproteobacteria bacterium]